MPAATDPASSCRHLFVYGTLMRGYPHPMADKLARNASFQGHAAYRGRLFLVETYPGVVPSSDAADVVQGDVFALNDASYLRTLDRYEGCGPDDPQPQQYRREIGCVALETGAVIDAWLYLYNWPVENLTRISSGRFSSAR